MINNQDVVFLEDVSYAAVSYKRFLSPKYSLYPMLINVIRITRQSSNVNFVKYVLLSNAHLFFSNFMVILDFFTSSNFSTDFVTVIGLRILFKKSMEGGLVGIDYCFYDNLYKLHNFYKNIKNNL